MNEAEWLACTDLPRLIKNLRGSGRDRKLRLFACACARRLSHLIPDGKFRDAIELAERFADGAACSEELSRVHKAGMESWFEAGMAWACMITGGMSVAIEEASGAALYTAMHVPDTAFPAGTPNRNAAKAVERQAHRTFLHDIFGNLFCPIATGSFWSSTVTALAQAAYDNRTLPSGELNRDRLAVLADALEDAGCTEAAILDHLRGQGPHVRGCIVVDWLLGKE